MTTRLPRDPLTGQRYRALAEVSKNQLMQRFQMEINKATEKAPNTAELEVPTSRAMAPARMAGR